MKNIAIILILCWPLSFFGQGISKKEVTQQMHSWLSLNSITKFNKHWGVAADLHIRENGFFESNNFNLVRAGIAYFPSSSVSLTFGYAHMWLAPTRKGWSTYAEENRLYEQLQLQSTLGKVRVLQRLRSEQRWQEKMANDTPTGELRFTNRVRYLSSFTIPIFKNSKWPSLVLSDEILLHFGKEVVYNTLDQNRLFVGIRQSINPRWSYDFGYMNVYQQKYSGFQYDMNHTLRLFFYLNTKIK